MKKIITISCVALTLFGATSCGDDFLSVDPSSSVPIDGYYNTESRIMEAVTAAYDPLQWYDYFSGWAPLSLVYDCVSDTCRTRSRRSAVHGLPAIRVSTVQTL